MRNKILAIGIAITCLLLTVTEVYAADTERVLYSADGVSVIQPYGLVADAAGNLYGASSPTGTQPGAIFRLSKGPAGHWNMTLIYKFPGGRDEEGAAGPLTIDSAGNLYGTTIGTVFKLTPSTYLPWRKTTLFSFTGSTDIGLLYGGVTLDSSGSLYGAAAEGGTGNGCGAVYEF